jgi:hypothetical protein
MAVTDMRQTRPLLREGAPTETTQQLLDRSIIWSQVPEWTRYQDILSD